MNTAALVGDIQIAAREIPAHSQGWPPAHHPSCQKSSFEIGIDKTRLIRSLADMLFPRSLVSSAVKRLESAGYITGYGAQINLAKLTESIMVFTEITLVDHRKEDFVRFEANLRNVEELMECHLVSGGYDYLLRFVSRSINHYQDRMENLLERNIGIEKYFSYIVLKSPIVKNALPLKTLLDNTQ